MTDLPAGWLEADLGNVATFVMGQAPPGQDCNKHGQGTPFVKAGEFGLTHPIIREWTSRPLKAAKPTDVLICVVGATCGKINLGADCAIGRSVAAIRPSDALRQDYLFNFLKTKVSSLRAGSTGSAQGVIAQGALAGIELPLAPLAEQRRIVAKIDSLSQRSKRAREHIDHLPRLVKRYKEAVLGVIFDQLNCPKESLHKHAEFITSGSRGWARYYSENGPLFIRVANVERGGVDLNFADRQYVSPPDNVEGTRTRVQPGDVVVTITADLGRVGVVPSDLGEAYVNQHVALVRLRDPSQGRFLAWYLTSPEGQKQLLERDRGVTRAGLGLEDIRAVEVPVISQGQRAATLGRINAAFLWINRIAAEATSARKLIGHLDQAILSKAFRGELVPQDPNDEPASMLLERIKAEKVGIVPARRGRGRPRLATAT